MVELHLKYAHINQKHFYINTYIAPYHYSLLKLYFSENKIETCHGNLRHI